MGLNIQRVKKNKPKMLNLVAMMDIFTVLVFFLIFNIHADRSFLESNADIDLPVSMMAEDNLEQKIISSTLELPNKDIVILDNNLLSVKSNNKDVIKQLKIKCTTNSVCNSLLIKAPFDIDYLYVDQFVKYGRDAGFQKIYLLVSQG